MTFTKACDCKNATATMAGVRVTDGVRVTEGGRVGDGFAVTAVFIPGPSCDKCGKTWVPVECYRDEKRGTP